MVDFVAEGIVKACVVEDKVACRELSPRDIVDTHPVVPAGYS